FYVLASDKIAFSSASGIKNALTRYNCDHGMSRTAIEAYNSQDIWQWAQDQRFVAELVHPTAPRQASAFGELYQAADEGRLHVHPSFEKLIRELRAMEYELKAGNDGITARFEAAKGSHDDHVYSMLWAIYALREIELNAYEVTGIVCTATGPAVRVCVLNGGEIEPPCSV